MKRSSNEQGRATGAERNNRTLKATNWQLGVNKECSLCGEVYLDERLPFPAAVRTNASFHTAKYNRGATMKKFENAPGAPAEEITKVRENATSLAQWKTPQRCWKDWNIHIVWRVIIKERSNYTVSNLAASSATSKRNKKNMMKTSKTQKQDFIKSTQERRAYCFTCSNS